MLSTTSSAAMLWLRRLLIAAAVVGVCLVAVAALGRRHLEARVHQTVVSKLSTALESTVELGAIRLSFFPLRFEADALTLRHQGRMDVSPLLVIQSLQVDLNLRDIWSQVVDRVTLDGMEVNIPPRPEGGGPRVPMNRTRTGDTPDVVIRHLTATNSRIAIIPREADRSPRVWDLFSLDMRSIATNAPATFTASVTNPVPTGNIEISGSFGPWQSPAPGSTPLSGTYTFAADLGTIRGLEGHLDAKGEMGGVLDQISTQGNTVTERFRIPRLDSAGVLLTTRYNAIVDGTKGDVELTSVDIGLGQSKLHASGVVHGTKGISGKRVTLKVASDAIDIADLLTFITNTNPPTARGTLQMDSDFDLPRGEGDVLDRLALSGSFRADELLFTSHDIQDQIDTLSRSGQGRPKDASIDDAASRVGGTFTLARGILTFKPLTFDVRGASVRMAGTYSLDSRAMTLDGQVRLTATVSQTQTGFKSWLLKPFDPLFRKSGAGTLLAIRVRGTAGKPDIGLDVGRTLNPD
jgi:hypothetical protein